MPGPSETLPVLEEQPVECLLDFERLDEAWPRGRTAIERAGPPRTPDNATSHASEGTPERT